MLLQHAYRPEPCRAPLCPAAHRCPPRRNALPCPAIIDAKGRPLHRPRGDQFATIPCAHDKCRAAPTRSAGQLCAAQQWAGGNVNHALATGVKSQLPVGTDVAPRRNRRARSPRGCGKSQAPPRAPRRARQMARQSRNATPQLSPRQPCRTQSRPPTLEIPDTARRAGHVQASHSAKDLSSAAIRASCSPGTRPPFVTRLAPCSA